MASVSYFFTSKTNQDVFVVQEYAKVRFGHLQTILDNEDENGDGGNYIVNKFMGEYTSVKDDGLNYILGLHIAPKHEAGFTRPEAR